jgi:KDO2-lipid IV(A) lauroyltransferase
MLTLRGRFGNRLVAMNDALRHVINHAKDTLAFGFISDQTPPPKGAYWTRFLNQDTPVFNGSEKIARKFDYPVVFFHIRKTGRGRYAISIDAVSEHSAAQPEDTITEAHVRMLEQDIMMQPAFWLWSHKRWKHKR